METNIHHIAKHGQGQLAYLYQESARLVENPSLKVRLINQECSPVPILGYYSLCNTIKEFHELKPTPDPLEGIENLFESLYRAQEHERAFPEEQALIRLVIGSISKQIPAIRSGLIIG